MTLKNGIGAPFIKNFEICHASRLDRSTFSADITKMSSGPGALRGMGLHNRESMVVGFGFSSPGCA